MTSNIKDVARRAGVSTATVSHVINRTRPVSPETQRKVENAIKGLNYQPNEFARTLRNKKSKIIDIYIHRETELAFINLGYQCLDQLITRFSELSFMVNVHFFFQEETPIETNPCLFISSQPIDKIKKHAQSIFLSLSTEIASESIKTIHLIDEYYHSIVQMIENQPETRFIMSYQQGEQIKRLYSKNPNYQDIFHSIHLYQSEISSELFEYLESSDAIMQPKLCILDYSISLGLIKKLLMQPKILSNIEQIDYYGYGNDVETFGLPINIRHFSVDPFMHKIVDFFL